MLLECSPSVKIKSQVCMDFCHSEWKGILNTALASMDQEYLSQLMSTEDWLPGKERLFAAFSLPLKQTQYVLVGESPYPREDSANGYAFWDNLVTDLWSTNGLSKLVNKATSLRNLIKMLLVARGDLQAMSSQQQIAMVDKRSLVRTAEQLFAGMMNKGILLLNASLVFSEGKVPFHARHWKPFMDSLLEQLYQVKPDVKLILLGKFAANASQNQLPIGLMAEHPYNVSFITNQKVIDFFKPLDLLQYESN
jgi:uracil-DNA glycosylase